MSPYWPALVPQAAGVPLEDVHRMIHDGPHADPPAAAAADADTPPRASGL